MRNGKLQSLAVSGLLFLLVMLASVVQCRQAPFSPEVEQDDPDRRATTGGMSMRRLHTDRPSPLGYPPPPTVAEPPESPSPSPSAV